MSVDTMNEMHAAKAERTKRVSLKSQAYETLKRRILNCELKPGAAVTVADLAVDLGMGRMPVLQAVERLTLDGLVEVMPRKGVVVSPVPWTISSKSTRFAC
ncbi:MAG: GntR family transcriptional regulator [Roseovarius pacificus]|nr:GntR family transcriptional regulator [Roseovarius pacificus]